MSFRFMPSLIVSLVTLCVPSSISFLIVPAAFPLLLVGWGLGRRGNGRDGLWNLGMAVIILLGVVTAWQWVSVHPYAEEPAHLEVLFRLLACATVGYLTLGVTLHLLRRRVSVVSNG